MSLDYSDIERLLNSFEAQIKELKDEIFRISWYMRGGVASSDLFHVYSYEDRRIILSIIKENIEATKNSQMPLV